MNSNALIAELFKWSNIYSFSFQFWGPANNNVFIEKDSIELASFGGLETPDDIMRRCLEWVEKHNPNGYKAPHASQAKNRCQGCGAVIAQDNDYCGECLCEDDSDY